MIPWRPECVLLDTPLGREDDKISHCHPRSVAGACEDSENGWILWKATINSIFLIETLTAWSKETAFTTIKLARSYLYE